MRHFILTVAVAGASGIAGLWPATASAQLTTAAEVHDLYTPAGPIVERDFRTQNYVGSITAERWRAGSSDFRQGGLAHARYTWTSGFDGTLVAGTSALARSDAGYNGHAQSSLGADFGIAVQMYGPNDGFSQLLWTQTMVQAGCSGDSGCVFNLSFLHQTTGRIAYANRSGDREASFSETVTLRSTSFGQTFEQRAAGEVAVRLRNNQTAAETRFSGDWSASDLQAFGPTPASQLGLFPTGDARNALDDPQGDLQGWNFRHTEVLTIPVHFWPSSTFGALGELQLFGEVAVSLDQLARAGIGPFVYSSSTLSVDFADTSTFSFASITDPQGVVDFSQTRVALVAAVVPEPNAAWMVLAGLAWLWARRRVRGG